MTILDRILGTKKLEVALAKQRCPVERLHRDAELAPAPRDFAAAIARHPHGSIRLIAEIKRASPSAGLLVPDFDVARIAREYQQCGAAALSVLTDETYFQGSAAHLREARDAVDLPLLRKEFIIDEYQIWEARAWGADAVLLIAEAIGVDEVQRFLKLSKSLGMGTLVEVHSRENLLAVLGALGTPELGAYILGINNRDLGAQRTDISHGVRLSTELPPNTPWVAESGLSTQSDVIRVQQAGASAILVGEALLRATSIEDGIRTLLGGSAR